MLPATLELIFEFIGSENFVIGFTLQLFYAFVGSTRKPCDCYHPWTDLCIHEFWTFCDLFGPSVDLCIHWFQEQNLVIGATFELIHLFIGF